MHTHTHADIRSGSGISYQLTVLYPLRSNPSYPLLMARVKYVCMYICTYISLYMYICRVRIGV